MKRIEDAFKEYTNREDIAIVLINQFIADMIRHQIANYMKVRTFFCATACVALLGHLHVIHILIYTTDCFLSTSLTYYAACASHPGNSQQRAPL